MARQLVMAGTLGQDLRLRKQRQQTRPAKALYQLRFWAVEASAAAVWAA